MTRSAPLTPQLEHAANRAPRHSVERLVGLVLCLHGVITLHCNPRSTTQCRRQWIGETTARKPERVWRSGCALRRAFRISRNKLPLPATVEHQCKSGASEEYER